LSHELKTIGRTFPVADVEPAGQPLTEASFQEALEGRFTAERLNTGEDDHPVEAWSHRTPRLLAQVEDHPFVAALHLAYAGHRPIALSPDMIWLLVCQGAANHIHANTQALRARFVQHPGRFTLEVEIRDDPRFRKGSARTPWPEVFDEFSKRIAQHIGPRHELLLPSFSTTGPVERAAAEIVLLDATQKYFHYSTTEFVCGIPSIMLEGSAADWQVLADRVDGFADLDLEWWLRLLRPVLEQFASAAAGDLDRAFWRAIYRHHPREACPAPDSAAGWFGVLFPYLVDQDGWATRRNPWLSGARDVAELLEPQRAIRAAGSAGNTSPDPDPGVVRDGEVPGGLSKAPFVWVQRDAAGELLHRWEMELIAGFIGVAQNPETLALRPEIGWAVRERHGADEASSRAVAGL